MSSRKFETPKGFFDYAGGEAGRLSEAQDTLFEVAGLYGAKELRIAPAGFEETYFADTNLDPDKTYQLKDKSDRTLVLNCDSLPAVMRSYVASNREKLARFMFSIPVFRYRNVKLRHYHHLGVSFINDVVTDTNETLIPGILIETLRRVSSQKIQIVCNDFRFWMMLFEEHGFSREDTRVYFFHRRFSNDKEKPADEAIPVLERIARNTAFADALDALHEEKPKEFADQRGRIEELFPSLAGRLASYHDRISALAHAPGVDRCVLNFNDFHSSEFFSALGYQLHLEGQEKRIADGGSYHEYGARFSPRIRSVYSGIIRHEDLLEHDDRLRQRKIVMGLYVMTDRKMEAERLIADLRARNIPVLEDATAKNIRKAAAYFRDEGFSHFSVIGDEELDSGVLRVTDMRTNETVHCPAQGLTLTTSS